MRRLFKGLKSFPLVRLNAIKYKFSNFTVQEQHQIRQYEHLKPTEFNNQIHRNPTKVGSRKALKDLFIRGDKILIENLKKLMDIPKDQFYGALKKLSFNTEDDQYLSIDQCEIFGYLFNFKIHNQVYVYENLPSRPPVITIMGHVDHGKTTLLDQLYNSQIADNEYGAITQKIGAFHIINKDNQRFTVIDTPGHEAFINMRYRGAQSTDLIILVVSASDGIQQQTIEVINIAKDAQVPIIVAINKIDVIGADPEQIENSLFEEAKLDLETHGGNIPVIHISAKFKKNIDLLEELILFESEYLDLRENKDCRAEGMVLESSIDQLQDQKSSTLIVQKGTLKLNDFIVIGENYSKVLNMKNDRQQQLVEAFPSHAVQISGLKELPEGGEPFFVVKNENEAKLITNFRQIENREKGRIKDISNEIKISFNNYYDRRQFAGGNQQYINMKYAQVEESLIQKIEKLKQFPDKIQELQKAEEDLEKHHEYVSMIVDKKTTDENMINIILKSPDQGTQETLLGQIKNLAQNYDGLQVQLVSASVGPLQENDLKDAEYFNAYIFCMDTIISQEAQKYIRQQKVIIKSHRIIYSLLEDINNLLTDKSNTGKTQMKFMGQSKVVDVFQLTKNKEKQREYRVIRSGVLVKDLLEVNTMKHLKDDVNKSQSEYNNLIIIFTLTFIKIQVGELQKGKEGGIGFINFNDIQKFDIIEAYDEIEYESKFRIDF